ncbi:MAG: hypothetical protein RBS80_17765 [Thermoguttaceae bacterium]|jgi:hypothetical protein|nr:hypothetical protein [Thermoguttaceae bacterium]
MIHLVLTLDYEIFGSGAGDVLRDIVEPTNRILDLCDRYSAVLTIMFEVGEYWAFREAEEQGLLRLDYSPAGEMEQQARRAIAHGHDVQLHLHPQWLAATLDGGIWRLRHDLWRFPDLPHGLGSRDDRLSMTGALWQGRQTLERLLTPVRPAYRCRAFRAGGFFLQPAAGAIRAMRSAGIVADSSVVPGYWSESPWRVDYRRAPADQSYWWSSADDVASVGALGTHILELPVFSRNGRYWNTFKWARLRPALKRARLEQRDAHSRVKGAARSTPSPMSVLRKLISTRAITVDFCKLSAADMLHAVGAAVDAVQRSAGSTVPLVMIGHSKDFWNDRHFESFLRGMETLDHFNGQVTFDSMDGVVGRILRQEHLRQVA